MMSRRRGKREEGRGKKRVKDFYSSFFHLPSSFLFSDRGSVLIATVWLLLVLSIYSIAIYHRAAQELVLGRWAKEQVETRLLARAGVERGILELQFDKFLTFDAYNETWGNNEKAFKEIKLRQGIASVFCDPQYQLGQEEDAEKMNKPKPLKEDVPLFGLCDEASRININHADQEILRNLFKAAVKDIDETGASTIAQSIIDWRDPDDAAQQSGAESSYYQFLKKPYQARNAPFESVEELLMIRGMDREIYDQVKSYLTVYTDGPVNFNTASVMALRGLGFGEDLANRLAEFRKGSDGTLGTEDDGVFQMVEGIAPALSAVGTFTSEDFQQVTQAIEKNMVSVESKVFRIQSIGRLNRSGQNVQALVTCVVKRSGMILYWHEGNL